MLQDNLTRGVIQFSIFLWSSPIVPFMLKVGDLRFCVDHGNLDSVTKKDC